MHIRKSKYRDKLSVLKIAKKFAKEISLNEKLAMLEDHIGSDKVIVACNEDDNPVGFVYAYLRGKGASLYSAGRDHLFVSAICVEPTFQKKGVANALMRELVASNSHRKICGHISLDSEAGLKLYKKNGFKESFVVFSKEAIKEIVKEGSFKPFEVTEKVAYDSTTLSDEKKEEIKKLFFTEAEKEGKKVLETEITDSEIYTHAVAVYDIFTSMFLSDGAEEAKGYKEWGIDDFVSSVRELDIKQDVINGYVKTLTKAIKVFEKLYYNNPNVKDKVLEISKTSCVEPVWCNIADTDPNPTLVPKDLREVEQAQNEISDFKIDFEERNAGGFPLPQIQPGPNTSGTSHGTKTSKRII